MDLKRRHVPAFGSWDCNGDLPFTQWFESASARVSEERDLYVAGDVLTPAMIAVPRHRSGNNPRKKQVWDCDQLKEGPKAVDEDLYKISPRAQSKTKRKRGWRLLSSCLSPCVY